jgi:hypothetical protein
MAKKSADKPLVHKPQGRDLGAVWLRGSELWFLQLHEGEEAAVAVLKGASLAEAVKRDGATLERWRFPSPQAASTAARWVRTALAPGRERALPGDTSGDLVRWSRAMKYPRSCMARLAPGGGPVAFTRDRTHPWYFPRPPSTSYLSGRLLVPVFSLVGPLDSRLGRRTGVYVSACPQAVLDPYKDHVFEVFVQDPSRKSPVDAYFVHPSGKFWSVHLSLQVSGIDGHLRWCITEHTGEPGTVGFLRSTHHGTQREAEKLFAARVKSIPWPYRPSKSPGPWHQAILREIDRYNRVRGQKALTLRMKAVHRTMVQTLSRQYFRLSANLLNPCLPTFGGAPVFCQEGADFSPPSPYGRTKALAVASFHGDALPAWSAVLNEGDVGVFNFWAFPGKPFGTASFSCG